MIFAVFGLNTCAPFGRWPGELTLFAGRFSLIWTTTAQPRALPEPPCAGCEWQQTSSSVGRQLPKCPPCQVHFFLRAPALAPALISNSPTELFFNGYCIHNLVHTLRTGHDSGSSSLRHNSTPGSLYRPRLTSTTMFRPI